MINFQTDRLTHDSVHALGIFFIMYLSEQRDIRH